MLSSVFASVTLFVGLIIIITLLSSASSSSSSPLFVHAETWAQAFEKLHESFKQNTVLKEKLHKLMEPVMKGASIGYADALCNDVNFITCTASHEDEPRGSSQSFAWLMKVTLTDVDYSGSAMDEILWEKLPHVVQSININKCISSPYLEAVVKKEGGSNNSNIIAFDLAKLISRLPKSVKSVTISNCNGIGIEEQNVENLFALAKLPHHYNNEMKDDEEHHGPLESLSIDHCTFRDSIFSPAVSLPWFNILGIRRFHLEASTFQTKKVAAVGLPKLIGMMNELNFLSLRVNEEESIIFDQIINALVVNASHSLNELEIDLSAPLLSVPAVVSTDDENNNIFFDEKKASLHLSHLNALERIYFVNVPFTRIPALPNSLKSLSLLASQIEGEFPDLSAFYNLERVDFTGNDIDHVDWSSSIPSTLKRVNLAGNLLEGSKFLADLSKLPRHLLEFNVSGNYLSGVNTMDFTKLPPQIQIFDISYNQLTGPVDISGKLPDSIKFFMINDNEFTGRYDLAKIPLLSTKIMVGNNNWDSLMPPR